MRLVDGRNGVTTLVLITLWLNILVESMVMSRVHLTEVTVTDQRENDEIICSD